MFHTGVHDFQCDCHNDVLQFRYILQGTHKYISQNKISFDIPLNICSVSTYLRQLDFGTHVDIITNANNGLLSS